MNRLKAIKTLRDWDNKGKYVFTKGDLRKIFPDEKIKSLTEGIQRLTKDGLLIRACRGIYVNPNATSFDSYAIEHIAKALRPGSYNYISLESMLSEYGIISQIPIDILTVMTTGREGIYKTPFGTIEFTHTKRSFIKIVKDLKQVGNRPLRIATKEVAWRDLKRVGRNTTMVDTEELHED